MKDINFLVHESDMEKGDADKKQKSMSAEKVLLTVLVITVAVVVLFLPGIYVGYLNNHIESVEDRMYDAKFQQVRSVKAQLQQKTTQTEIKKKIIHAIDAKSISGTQILLMINHALPENCYYSNVQYNGQQLSISGVANSSFIAAELMANLDRLKSFTKSAESLQIEKAQTPVKYNVQYQVSNEGGK